ncbi:MAG: aldo/keto reductase [Phycisphaerae bacterium]|nr:aldo/keto reductase [Phycisphaerae bacterium]
MSDQSNMDVTRRGFLRSAAAVGMGSVAAGLSGRVGAAEAKAPAAQLPTNPLGARTKLNVTRVSYGSLNTSGGRGSQLLQMVVEAGVNMVHNSSSYKNGNAIDAMGKVFDKNKGMRDKLTLCLKGRAADLEGELDKMLKDLHTDHCDVYLPELHDPDERRLDKIRKVQDDLKKKGKIRFTGFVCHGALNKVFEMVLAKAPKYFDAALISTEMIVTASGGGGNDETKQYMANVKKLKEDGIGIISMKSKAREAMNKGKDTFQAHCKALLAGGADTVLFTFASLQQVDTLKQMDLKSLAMTSRERHLAKAFHARHAGACLMCSRCTESCPRGMPVNDLMRIRMYHDENGDCDYARDTYRDLGGDLKALASGCGSCTACKDACPIGLAGSEHVRYVTSIYG